jgi:hypothetical protein
MVSKTYNRKGITSIIGLTGFMLGLETSSLTAFLSAPQFISYFGPLSVLEHTMVASSNAIGAVST